MLTERLQHTVGNWKYVKGYTSLENNYRDIKRSLEARGYTLLDCEYPKVMFTPYTKQAYKMTENKETYGVIDSEDGLNIVRLEYVSIPTTFESIKQIEHKYQDVVSNNTISFEISVADYNQMMQYSKIITENVKQVKDELEEAQKQSFAFQEQMDTLTDLLKDCNGERDQLLETILGVIQDGNKTPIEKYQTLLVQLEEVATALHNKRVVTD
ncbi:hypothetical protein ACQUY5_23660 [Bacillus cereus]|uniref:hypothetical protein n=1 Tax=Bacillus cereus TaxID=1396 RepID=UPI003D16C3CB